MRCSSTRAIADSPRASLASAASKVAANDSSESKGKWSATQSTRDPARKANATKATRSGPGSSREIDESGRVQRRRTLARATRAAPRRCRQDGRQLVRERCVEGRTTPLQDAHLQAVGAARLQAEAQR